MMVKMKKKRIIKEKQVNEVPEMHQPASILEISRASINMREG